jgi:hypothetical protein
MTSAREGIAPPALAEVEEERQEGEVAPERPIAAETMLDELLRDSVRGGASCLA